MLHDDDADDEDGPTNEQNALFAKGPDTPAATAELESPIKRVYYINPYGQVIHSQRLFWCGAGTQTPSSFQEVFPKPNPEFLTELRSREILVYSVGSLWTSIIPCLGELA